MQDTSVHTSNLIVAYHYEGKNFDANNDFYEWVSERHRGYMVIAHFIKRYHSYFILKYCVENTIKPCTIYIGTILMLLQIKDLRPVFPKLWLERVEKGYFPHLFEHARESKIRRTTARCRVHPTA